VRALFWHRHWGGHGYYGPGYWGPGPWQGPGGPPPGGSEQGYYWRPGEPPAQAQSPQPPSPAAGGPGASVEPGSGRRASSGAADQPDEPRG
jgi:hypothetical protein